MPVDPARQHKHHQMRILLSLLLTFVLLLATLWGAGAIWMRLPLGEFGRGAVAALEFAVRNRFDGHISTISFTTRL